MTNTVWQDLYGIEIKGRGPVLAVSEEWNCQQRTPEAPCMTCSVAGWGVPTIQQLLLFIYNVRDNINHRNFRAS